MNRLVISVLVASIAYAPAAFAGESLLKSGARHVQQITVAESAKAPVQSPASGAAASVGQKVVAPSYQSEGGNLSKSGMGKGMKTLLYVGLAVGFAASVWAIDHHVLDVTPSSLGTRQD